MLLPSEQLLQVMDSLPPCKRLIIGNMQLLGLWNKMY